MLADLDLLLTAVFVTADDLLPDRQKNARRSVTDAEVVSRNMGRELADAARQAILRDIGGPIVRLCHSAVDVLDDDRPRIRVRRLAEHAEGERAYDIAIVTRSRRWLRRPGTRVSRVGACVARPRHVRRPHRRHQRDRG
jgi:hypothetical protein